MREASIQAHVCSRRKINRQVRRQLGRRASWKYDAYAGSVQVQIVEAVWKNLMKKKKKKMIIMTAMTTYISYQTNDKSGCNVRSERTHSYWVGS
jgi:hypothetical protein